MGQILQKTGAVGTKDTAAFICPEWAAGIYAVGTRGAGVESVLIEFSDGSPDQEIPGTDIAEQTNVNQLTFCEMNKPLKPGVQVHITASGTGTAACKTYAIFAAALTGPQYTWVKGTINTATASRKAKICTIPTFVSRLERVFVRSVNGEGIGIILGSGGRESIIPVRHIALNTDAVPFGAAFCEIREPIPAGGEIQLGDNDSGTGGASAFYFVML